MLSIFKRKNKFNNFNNIHIDEAEYTVIDTELTGLNENKDTIIAIGSIKMKGKTIKLGEIFYRKIKPKTYDFKDSIKIHEITPSELEKCPDIKPILKEFLSFCKDSFIIGHYILIDLCFLKKEINRQLNKSFNLPAIDTFLIYKWLVSKGMFSDALSDDPSLQNVANYLGVQVKNLHNALSDAFITAQIFQRLLNYLGELKLYTIQDLLNIGSPDFSKYMEIKRNGVFQL